MSLTSPQQVLDQVFGFTEFRPPQQAVIDGILQGRDQFVLMPTGGGKSLCYQIPALLRDGVAIVVSPLISLMQDQVAALQANGVSAAYYNSALSSEQSRQVLAMMHNHELDLLYVAPERLMMDSFLQRLTEIDIALFAIDETHCVSQWGHDFRPEYVQLGQLKQTFSDVPMIALTATADQQTRQDVIAQLCLQQPEVHVASFDRPNIRYTVLEKHRPFDQLIQFVRVHAGQAGIVYCTTRKKVDDITSKLQSAGISCLAYHAGLPIEQRQQAQQAFQRDDINIIVATVAFGMGIDKPNVRFIVHFNIAKNIENYYQETGRSGRDNLPAEALMLYALSDLVQVKVMLEKTENQNQRRIELHKLNAIAGFAEAQTCRRQVLLNYFGEQLANPCGNCDICLQPPEQYDATVDAQKALSCVYRVGQRFGLSHVIDILRGRQTARMRQYRHDKLSTFGIGHDLSEQAWLSVCRQLIHLGFLHQDISRYSILLLTEKAKPLLRKEMTLMLAKPRAQLDKSTDKVRAKKASKVVSELPYDKQLFQNLRQLRKAIADRDNVPPFIVFSDATLVEMAAYLPADEQSLMAINGVGEHKLAAYGTQFLEEINKFAN
jgi:ATP-dependent DNA helicase RecQ